MNNPKKIKPVILLDLALIEKVKGRKNSSAFASSVLDYLFKDISKQQHFQVCVDKTDWERFMKTLHDDQYRDATIRLLEEGFNIKFCSPNDNLPFAGIITDTPENFAQYQVPEWTIEQYLIHQTFEQEDKEWNERKKRIVEDFSEWEEFIESPESLAKRLTDSLGWESTTDDDFDLKRKRLTELLEWTLRQTIDPAEVPEAELLEIEPQVDRLTSQLEKLFEISYKSSNVPKEEHLSMSSDFQTSTDRVINKIRRLVALLKLSSLFALIQLPFIVENFDQVSAFQDSLPLHFQEIEQSFDSFINQLENLFEINPKHQKAPLGEVYKSPSLNTLGGTGEDIGHIIANLILLTLMFFWVQPQYKYKDIESELASRPQSTDGETQFENIIGSSNIKYLNYHSNSSSKVEEYEPEYFLVNIKGARIIGQRSLNALVERRQATMQDMIRQKQTVASNDQTQLENNNKNDIESSKEKRIYVRIKVNVFINQRSKGALVEQQQAITRQEQILVSDNQALIKEDEEKFLQISQAEGDSLIFNFGDFNTTQVSSNLRNGGEDILRRNEGTELNPNYWKDNLLNWSTEGSSSTSTDSNHVDTPDQNNTTILVTSENINHFYILDTNTVSDTILSLGIISNNGSPKDIQQILQSNSIPISGIQSRSYQGIYQTFSVEENVYS